MITNFDYLKKDSKFSRFADVAISAEKIILMDPEASILNSRRAMEFAIKWMYSVDSELEMPYQDNLQSLMNAEEYRQIVGPDLWKRMDYIRRSGNSVAHNNKKLGVDVSKGRQQAKLYADLLEQEYKRRPVIFMTNGFETRIIDGQYPERKCASIYSKRDLEKWFNLLTMRTSLKHVTVDKDIAGRYYQEAAVKAVCNSFDEKNRRKALLVMATGSGKTRTVIALCDCLLKAGWVKNILFLADRNSLVTQAKRSFVNMLISAGILNFSE